MVVVASLRQPSVTVYISNISIKSSFLPFCFLSTKISINLKNRNVDKINTLLSLSTVIRNCSVGRDDMGETVAKRLEAFFFSFAKFLFDHSIALS